VPRENSSSTATNPPPANEIVSSAEAFKIAAADPALNEDLALALLQRTDLPPEFLNQLAKNPSVVKRRKVKLAIIGHPKTPRYVSIALLRQLFTFDLMRVALTPVISGDIKTAAEELLIKRLESLATGERMSLARRATGRVAGALLLDPEVRVIRTALQNSRLTEALVVKALRGAGSPAALVRTVCEHNKWSLRREIRIALLGHAKTPIRFVEEFSKTIPVVQLRDILHSSRLPAAMKKNLLKQFHLKTH